MNKITNEKPWLSYYPKEMRELKVKKCSLNKFIKKTCINEELVAIKFYEREITFKELFETSEKVAKALYAYGFRKGDQIPVFLESVPEFLMILFGAEQIGASIVCRDGSIKEEVEVITKINAETIFVHDYIEKEKEEAFKKAGVKNFITISPTFYAKKIPNYIATNIKPKQKYDGINWLRFLSAGNHIENLEICNDYNAPLLRAYTTGTTGDSKQVIHSAGTIINLLTQMYYVCGISKERTTWLCTALPPSLIAVVVSMMLTALTSNKTLILDPFVAAEDVDLSFMYYKPNGWPIIPMFVDVLLNSKRIPEDFDMSFFKMSGAGAEFLNKKAFRKINKFLRAHNCELMFSPGYGMSEACSNALLPVPDTDLNNFGYGIPMPLTTISVFKEGTDQELNYNEFGEICIHSDSVMLGYDNEEETNKTILTHSDGKQWLHTGDIGRIDEKGHVYILNRGYTKHHTGGNLFISVMENKIIDIKGIKDAFFVLVPDKKHKNYYLPYLYIVLKDGVKLNDIKDKINKSLDKHERPVEIFVIEKRPFFHFKTARKLLVKEIIESKK